MDRHNVSNGEKTVLIASSIRSGTGIVRGVIFGGVDPYRRCSGKIARPIVFVTSCVVFKVLKNNAITRIVGRRSESSNVEFLSSRNLKGISISHQSVICGIGARNRPISLNVVTNVYRQERRIAVYIFVSDRLVRQISFVVRPHVDVTKLGIGINFDFVSCIAIKRNIIAVVIREGNRNANHRANIVSRQVIGRPGGTINILATAFPLIVYFVRNAVFILNVSD